MEALIFFGGLIVIVLLLIVIQGPGHTSIEELDDMEEYQMQQDGIDQETIDEILRRKYVKRRI